MNILRRIRSWLIDGFRRLRRGHRRRTLTNTLPPEIFCLILAFVRTCEPCFLSKIPIEQQQEDSTKGTDDGWDLCLGILHKPGRKAKDTFGSIRIWSELQLRLVNAFCLTFVSASCKLCLKITCSPSSAAPESFETELTYIGHGCDMVLFSHPGKSKFKGYSDLMTSYWLASVEAVVLHLDLSAHHSCSADIWPWLSSVLSLLPPNIRSLKLLLRSDKSRYSPAAFSALWRGSGRLSTDSAPPMPQDLADLVAKLAAEQLKLLCFNPPEFDIDGANHGLVEPAVHEVFQALLRACDSASGISTHLRFLLPSREGLATPARPAVSALELVFTNFDHLAALPPLAAGNSLEAVVQVLPSLKAIRLVRQVLSDAAAPVDFSPFLQLNQLESVEFAGDVDLQSFVTWLNVPGSSVEILHPSIRNLSVTVRLTPAEGPLTPIGIATFKKLTAMSADGLKSLRLVRLFTVQQCRQLFLAKLAKLTSLTSLYLQVDERSAGTSRDDDITQLLSAIKASMPNLVDLSLIHDTLAMIPAMPVGEILKGCPESVSALCLGGNLISIAENAFLDSLTSAAGRVSLCKLLENLMLAPSFLQTIHLDFEIFRPADAKWPPFMFQAFAFASNPQGGGVIETVSDGAELKCICVDYNESDEAGGVKPCIRVQVIRPDGRDLKIKLKFVAKTPVID